MKYTIKTPYKTVTKKRSDSAAKAFYQLAYEAIAAQGGLDTKWGHELINSVSTMCDELQSYSLISFSRPLPHNAGFVTFEKE